MADAITIKALQDASLDAKSLEDVVNGDEAKQVTTRLGETYPSVKKAIKMLFENGGIAGRFKTLVDLQASSLVDGAYALVSDDAGDKNGIYIKDDGIWVKSEYDVLTSLKNYKNALISSEKSSGNLLDLFDSNGTPYGYIRNDAHLGLVGLRDTLQNMLNPIDDSYKPVSDGVNIIELTDKDGVPLLALSRSGELTVNSINAKINNIESSNFAKTISKLKADSAASKNFDRLIALSQSSEVNIEHVFYDVNNHGYDQVSSAFGVRLAKDKFLLFYSPTVGSGDFAVSHTECVKLTVGEDNSLSFDDPVQITSSGSDEHGEFAMVASTSTILTTGAKKGRIILSVLKRWGETKDESYILISDDDGANWSEPKHIKQFVPKYDEWRLTGGAPGNGIQITEGKHKGRIIIPYWHATQEYPNGGDMRSIALISDDDGETFFVGAESSLPYSNECIAAELDTDVIVFYMRVDNNHNKRYRAFSYDGGITLSDYQIAPEFVAGDVAAGLVQCKNDYDFNSKKTVMTAPITSRRGDPYFFISYNGINFDVIKSFSVGYGIAYSSVMPIDAGRFLVLCEDAVRRQAKLHIINLKFLLSGDA